MTGKNDDLEHMLEKVFQHIIQHSDEPIHRATRILLLGNSGGLALALNASSLSLTPNDILGPSILFVAGIILSGAGPVFEGVTLAGLKGIQQNKEAAAKALQIVTDKVRAQTEGDTSKADTLDVEEILPAAVVRKGQPAKCKSLIAATVCFCGGVLWGFWNLLQAAAY